MGLRGGGQPAGGLRGHGRQQSVRRGRGFFFLCAAHGTDAAFNAQGLAVHQRAGHALPRPAQQAAKGVARNAHARGGGVHVQTFLIGQA